MSLRLLNKTNLIILLVVIMAGCKKLDLKPTNKYSDENFWQVNGNAFNALATCYSQQISGGYGGSSSAAQGPAPASNPPPARHADD